MDDPDDQIIQVWENIGNDLDDPVIQVLEEIDDDLDELGIMFVKIDDEKEAEEYGISNLPAIGKFIFEFYFNPDMVGGGGTLSPLSHSSFCSGTFMFKLSPWIFMTFQKW